MKAFIFILLIIQCSYQINLKKEQNTLENEENIYHIKLQRKEITGLQKEQINQFITKNQIYGKTNSHFKSFLQKTTSQSSLKLTNVKNSQYTGEISIGDPQNVFNVIYDTGSANIWINSKLCKNQECKKRKQYDHDLSDHYKRENLQLDVEFGTGELKGQFSQDTFYFGGIEIEKQEFVEIGEEIGMVFQDQQFDGLVGLAFPSMAAYNKNSIFDNIIQQKKLNKNILSFYMSKNQGKNDSQLTIGGFDKSRIVGQVNYHKVLKEYYWIFKADNILLGGKDIGLCDDGCYLVADTGTSLITGPENKVMKLLDAINVNEDCSNRDQFTNQDITFVVDGHKYTLTQEDYIVEENYYQSVPSNKTFIQVSSKICTLGIMPLDIPNDDEGFKYEKAWILGDIFLQKYYSIYDRDNNRVGFGLANHKYQ